VGGQREFHRTFHRKALLDCSFLRIEDLVDDVAADQERVDEKESEQNNKLLRLYNKYPESIMIGKYIAGCQFYLYGRWHFTRSGWETASKTYDQPDILLDPSLNLKGKVFLVTGGNAGIGREMVKFIAEKGGTIYMFCRSETRAKEAVAIIQEKTKNNDVHIIVGDCGVGKDVSRMWKEFIDHQESNGRKPQLDALICNAGALSDTKQMTSENVEETLATHLVFGTYLLGSLAMPLLEQTVGGRMVVVSSGGMYCTKFPSWPIASAAEGEYDGQLAYAYAKRGQLLLCERWAARYPGVAVVSCHPGWVLTEGLQKVYPESVRRWLEPLRSPWQGCEGIIWLAVAPREQIRSGEFYLDRTPQPKHLAGPFFTEGSATKNTTEEVDELMRMLELWSREKPQGK
jgi:NAD(P)-dependent dehydrogenase (short-subunit alcohol dehydrogenase family)